MLPPGHVFDSRCRLARNPAKDKLYDSLICDSQSGINLGLDDEFWWGILDEESFGSSRICLIFIISSRNTWLWIFWQPSNLPKILFYVWNQSYRQDYQGSPFSWCDFSWSCSWIGSNLLQVSSAAEFSCNHLGFCQSSHHPSRLVPLCANCQYQLHSWIQDWVWITFQAHNGCCWGQDLPCPQWVTANIRETIKKKRL